MAEYIKREELKEMLRREWTKYVPMELDPSIAYVLAKIDELPSIDIVKCKGCKYWLPHTQCGHDEDYDEYHNYCAFHMPDDEWYAQRWNAEDYCSDGERKDETD